MDSPTPAAAGAADRRRAHRRVGACAGAAFLALLPLGALRGPAQAQSVAPVATPAATPAATPTVVPTQPAPTQTPPGSRSGDDDDPGVGRGGGGRGFGGGGIPGGGAGAPGGGGSAPAPSTGGGSST